MMACCSTVICNGCVFADKKREAEANLEMKCPFCRTPVPKTDAETSVLRMKRVEANNQFALQQAGMRCHVARDFAAAGEYWEKAAGLGHVESHYNLSDLYQEGGHGVEKDVKKSIYHLEQAAIGGHPIARHNLGCSEADKGNIDRAVKHFIIAANLGIDEPLQALKSYYAQGVVSKENFAASLRAHQAAVDVSKIPREKHFLQLEKRNRGIQQNHFEKKFLKNGKNRE